MYRCTKLLIHELKLAYRQLFVFMKCLHYLTHFLEDITTACFLDLSQHQSSRKTLFGTYLRIWIFRQWRWKSLDFSHILLVCCCKLCCWFYWVGSYSESMQHTCWASWFQFISSSWMSGDIILLNYGELILLYVLTAGYWRRGLVDARWKHNVINYMVMWF
jgi:hypothetical protein